MAYQVDGQERNVHDGSGTVDAARAAKGSGSVAGQAVAWLITAVLIALFTWGIAALQKTITGSLPYAILYIIPVAFGGALLGVRGGLAAAVAALVLDRALLNNEPLQTPTAGIDDAIRFACIALTMLIVAVVTGSLRNAFRDLQKLNLSLIESEARRLNFNREVLLAVTSGRLLLCDGPEIDRMTPGEPLLAMAIAEPRDVAELRHHIRDFLTARELCCGRLDELEVGATEAATNAIKHGNGGVAEIRVSDSTITVLVRDRGTGISPSDLARATLERGYSTRVSLGMGFTMMLETADLVALCTSPTGTTLLIRSNLDRDPVADIAGVGKFGGLERFMSAADSDWPKIGGQVEHATVAHVA